MRRAAAARRLSTARSRAAARRGERGEDILSLLLDATDEDGTR